MDIEETLKQILDNQRLIMNALGIGTVKPTSVIQLREIARAMLEPKRKTPLKMIKNKDK